PTSPLFPYTTLFRSIIADPERRALVCVAQDAPRKALPLLLAEWMEFKRRPEGEGWSLILKSSPLDPAVAEFSFVTRFWEQVQALDRKSTRLNSSHRT